MYPSCSGCQLYPVSSLAMAPTATCLLAAACALLTACASPPASDVAPPDGAAASSAAVGNPSNTAVSCLGTQIMVLRLQSLKHAISSDLDPFQSEARSEVLGTRLAALDKEAAATLELRVGLARELLACGSTPEAIAHLQEAERLFASGLRTTHPGYHLKLLTSLAAAWMRLGEQENCILHHGADSCILPIPEGGRHSQPRGSRHALDVLRRILDRYPAEYESRWMYNVAAMTLGDWPEGVPPDLVVPASAFDSEQAVPRFRDAAADVGITYRGLAGGACVDDFDGDGVLDILTSEWAPHGTMKFFRGVAGHFVDHTSVAGLAQLTGGANLLHADLNNDGDADVLVLRGALRGQYGATEPLSLLENNGSGSFCDVTEEAGLLGSFSTQAAAIADYDGDGRLDIFVGNEAVGLVRLPCHLYRQDDTNRFYDAAPELGLDFVAHVKGCAWGDYDNDRDPDLVVTQIGGSLRLFRNDIVRFQDATSSAGLQHGTSSSLCGWTDFNNDGFLDLFAVDHGLDQGRAVCRDYLGLTSDGARPHLFLNTGKGTFLEVTREVNLWRVVPAIGGNFGDIDNDGWPDIYAATGEPSLMALYPNRLFRNDSGDRFYDVTTAAGVGHLQKGSATAFADLDQDGDQDIFVVMGGYFAGDTFHRALYENPGSTNSWTCFVLEGHKANRSAIGARVRVAVRRPDGSSRDIHHLVGTGGSMGSQSLQAEIGLGDATAIEQVEVRWPGSGTVQVFTQLPMRRTWKLIEEQDEPIELKRTPFKLGAK
jgi:hypothetical protein